MVRNRRPQGLDSGIGEADSMAQNRNFKASPPPDETKGKGGDTEEE